MVAFLGAHDFLELLANFRVLWIQGRPGGGKTSLSIWLAQWLVEARYSEQVVSNFPLSGGLSGEELPVPFSNCALIFDEAGLFMDTWRLSKMYLAYTRKLNHFLLMPSFLPPHTKLCFFTAWRVQAYDKIKLPLWVYRWRLRMSGVREEGRFYLWHPDRVFGLYDTRYMAADDGGIMDAVTAEIKRRGVRVAQDTGESGDLSDAASNFAWAVDALGDMTDERKQGRRGRRG